MYMQHLVRSPLFASFVIFGIMIILWVVLGTHKNHLTTAILLGTQKHFGFALLFICLCYYQPLPPSGQVQQTTNFMGFFIFSRKRV